MGFPYTPLCNQPVLLAQPPVSGVLSVLREDNLYPLVYRLHNTSGVTGSLLVLNLLDRSQVSFLRLRIYGASCRFMAFLRNT